MNILLCFRAKIAIIQFLQENSDLKNYKKGILNKSLDIS